MSDNRNPLLYVSDLKKYFAITSNILRSKGQIRAVDDVTFTLREGETLGIVGETGCGKTTLGRTILRLIPATDGDVFFDLPPELMNEIIEAEERFRELISLENPSQEESEELDKLTSRLIEYRRDHSLTEIRSSKMREYRKKMQPIFQDPFSSLDPRKLVKDIIAEPMRMLTDKNGEEIFSTEKKLIEEIGLSEDHLYRFPHEFSGGQRQRIGIARAISIEPKLLVLDEPTSALDVSVQAQILNMLRDIQNKRGISYLFISHHLSVIRLMADRVAVMYLGKIVELTDTDALFTNMLHPYTKALLSAIPTIDQSKKRERIILAGEIPSPADPPQGCHFHPRCPEAMRTCGWSPRDLSDPVRSMLEPYRNPEARAFPEVSEIVLEDQAGTLDIVFAAPQNDTEHILSLFNQLIDKETALPGGVRFKAIENITFTENNQGMRIKMIPPQTPHLFEYKKEHFVSCLLYPDDKEKKDEKKPVEPAPKKTKNTKKPKKQERDIEVP